MPSAPTGDAAVDPFARWLDAEFGRLFEGLEPSRPWRGAAGRGGVAARGRRARPPGMGRAAVVGAIGVVALSGSIAMAARAGWLGPAFELHRPASRVRRTSAAGRGGVAAGTVGTPTPSRRQRAAMPPERTRAARLRPSSQAAPSPLPTLTLRPGRSGHLAQGRARRPEGTGRPALAGRRGRSGTRPPSVPGRLGSPPPLASAGAVGPTAVPTGGDRGLPPSHPARALRGHLTHPRHPVHPAGGPPAPRPVDRGRPRGGGRPRGAPAVATPTVPTLAASPSSAPSPPGRSAGGRPSPVATPAATPTPGSTPAAASPSPGMGPGGAGHGHGSRGR